MIRKDLQRSLDNEKGIMYAIKKLTTKLVGIQEDDVFMDVFKPLKHTNSRIADRFSMDYHKAFDVLEWCVEELKKDNYYFLIEMENDREVVAVDSPKGMIVLIVLFKDQAQQLIPITSLNLDQTVNHYDGTKYSIAKLIKELTQWLTKS